MGDGAKEWMFRIGTAFVAALVAYFTAQGTTDTKIQRIDTREEAHFQQIMQRVDDVRGEVNYIRDRIDAALNQR